MRRSVRRSAFDIPSSPDAPWLPEWVLLCKLEGGPDRLTTATSIAASVRPSTNRSLYKIDHFQTTRRFYARPAARPRVVRCPRLRIAHLLMCGSSCKVTSSKELWISRWPWVPQGHVGPVLLKEPIDMVPSTAFGAAIRQLRRGGLKGACRCARRVRRPSIDGR
jgi:hypothetical protein